MNISIEEHFWSKVDRRGPNDCWIRRAYKSKMGYTRMTHNGERDMAHRISWALENGPVPEGMMVLHSCDNPGCVNPAHLFLGTHFDNMRDMVAKKRQARGESVYRSKLTAEDVREIRQLIAIGRSHGGIAREYGVLRTAIGNINTGYTWAWLK